ncbi:5-formyltetrahydrofolate cyclo-ligase [Candidatus Woesearchaeota archaeon]|nr:5-formyltetrahydrofolate cyclo-ligase [Candidatus Woesearchaeota archaeon]
MSKDTIRKKICTLRDAHDKRLREEKSVQIAEALQKQKEFMKAKTICIYLSKGSEVDLNETKSGVYDILEPKKMRLILPEQVDLFIVPGIAFDNKCSRIGYGQGYYDKLLSTTRKPKVGLAYSFQMVESISAEPTDIAMDKVITEKEVYGKNT